MSFWRDEFEYLLAMIAALALAVCGIVVIAVLSIGLCGLGVDSACGPGQELTAGKAVARGVAHIEAHGVDLENMSVTVTSTSNRTITLPVGTRFLSSSGGTQNMISASTIRFAFMNASPTSPQTITQQIPVYCINRFLDAPTSVSQFSVSYSEETDPVRKLVECLEKGSASHSAKQMAVWMVSDHLIDLSPDDLARRFVDEGEAKWHRHATGPELAELLKGSAPSTSTDVLDSIKNMSPDQIESVFQQLRPTLRKKAEEEAQKYATEAGSLLRDCGTDLSTTVLYRGR
jgi:hypothetical protein